MKNISKTTGLLAKKLGYTDNSDNWSYFSKKNNCLFSTNSEGGISGEEETFKMCTQTQLQTWLRKKGVEVWARPQFNRTGKMKYESEAHKHNGDGICSYGFNSYEKAMEYALKEGLKQLKKNK